MTRPGERLRGYASRWCSGRTMDRLIDPVVADLQTEHDEAVRAGRLWKSRWILLAGYFACAKVIATCGMRALTGTTHDWTADDLRALNRSIGFSSTVIVASTILLIVPQLLHQASALTDLPPRRLLNLILLLIPQALPVAVPLGILLGILWGPRSGVISRGVMKVILAAALVSSLASLANVAWILPAANQAFRVGVMGTTPARGVNELSLGELGRQIDASKRGEAASFDVRLAEAAYHFRLSLSGAPFALAVFALSALARRPRGRTTQVLAASGAVICYYAFIWGARPLVLRGAVPAFAAAWLPNIVVLGSAALMTALTRRPTRLT